MKKYKVTGWTYFNNRNYKELPEGIAVRKVHALVVEEIKKKGYRICGESHQCPSRHCVPVINKKYRYEVSFRTWGRIMAEAYGIEGDLAYCDWAWIPPKGTKEILPE